MDLKGLTNDEVAIRQKQYGKNELFKEKRASLAIKILLTIKEPMFILLLVTATIYFILGEPRDGIIMIMFVIIMITIESIQEWKTDKTLKALKSLSSPNALVIRNGIECEIASEELVPDDIMIVYEGVKIPADGIIIDTTGICIDQSSLTGESEGIWKVPYTKDEEGFFKSYMCYAGTVCIQGKAYVRVTKTGVNSEYGKIGNTVLNEKESKTALERETSRLVKICAIVAFVLFLLVTMITFFVTNGAIKDRIINSILAGITLAMAMIPEEFPVILTVFLSMGAYRLGKRNSIVKKLSKVETLGAISVLCVDKTGTITKNQMELCEVCSDLLNEENDEELIRLSCFASLKDAFDNMEIAIWNYAKKYNINIDEKLVKSFPFTNETRLMGNVYYNDDKYILAVKGAYEAVIKLCSLDNNQVELIENKVKEMSLRGLRVLAIAKEESDLPIETLENRKMEFIGLIAFIDPEREEIKDDIKTCYKAGVRVIMITGDSGDTASAIAKRIGMMNSNRYLTGDDIENMSDKELEEQLKTVNIFSRVTPSHKMRIVNALKQLGHIVAMTGDGVNDAPALKKADIGIAMGKRGSEVSREAADLVLLDDNFHTIVNTIHDGRRIYSNIKKAIGYVFTIHIPIALSSLIAPMLGITSTLAFLLPIHVVLMELIIDPTCSVVLERQPADDDIMENGPRNTKKGLITKGFLFRTIIQGLILFMASFGLYYAYYIKYNDVLVARSIGIVVLFLGNIFLVNVNASDHELAYHSFKKLSHDRVMMLINLISILIIAIIVYSPFHHILSLEIISFKWLMLAVMVSVVSIFWIELLKIFKNKYKKEN